MHSHSSYIIILREVCHSVLILVLMEDALALQKQERRGVQLSCLNPCFTGRCTRTQIKQSEKTYQGTS